MPQAQDAWRPRCWAGRKDPPPEPRKEARPSPDFGAQTVREPVSAVPSLSLVICCGGQRSLPQGPLLILLLFVTRSAGGRVGRRGCPGGFQGVCCEPGGKGRQGLQAPEARGHVGTFRPNRFARCALGLTHSAETGCSGGELAAGPTSSTAGSQGDWLGQGPGVGSAGPVQPRPLGGQRWLWMLGSEQPAGRQGPWSTSCHCPFSVTFPSGDRLVRGFGVVGGGSETEGRL